MATSLILGPARAGKTSRLLDEAAARVEGGSSAGILFLSPSAGASALARRLLAGRLGGALVGARFETFMGLSRSCLASMGRPAGRRADEVIQSALASAVIDEESAGLEYLAGIIPAPGLPRAVASFAAELAAAGLTGAELESAAVDAGEELPPEAARQLSLKCADLARLSGGLLEALDGAGFITGETICAAALSALDEVRDRPESVEPRLLLVDGFGRYTPVQLRLLAQLAESAGETIITLTWDRGGERPFQEAERTRKALAAAIDGLVEERLDHHPSSAEADLVHLERHVLAPGRSGRLDGFPSVEIIAAAGEATECRLVARRILELTETGIDLAGVGIFLRSPETYVPLLRDEFARLGIPIDGPASYRAAGAPSVRTLSAWMDAIFCEAGEVDLLGCLRGRLSPEHCWKAESAAAPLSRVGLDEADLLARSAGGEAGEAILDCVRLIAELRDDLAPGEPRSREAASYADAAKRVATILSLPRTDFAPSDLAARRDAAAAAEFVRAAKDCALSHEAGGEEIPYERFSGRMNSLLASSAGPAPVRPNRGVLVRSVFETRTAPIRIAFVMGLADGRFPARRREGPFLSDVEREMLSRAGASGLERPDPESEEDLLFYIAATRPSERLILTRPASDGDGKELLPSIYLEETAILFESPITGAEGMPVVEIVPSLQSARTPSEARARLALDLNSPAPVKADAKKTLGAAAALHNAMVESLPEVHLAAITPRVRPDTGTLAATRAHEWLARRAARPLSPTGIEAFAQCPFRHLVRRLLKLESEPEPGVTPLAEGDMLHRALAAAFAAAGGRPLAKADRDGMIAAGTAELDGAATESFPGGLDAAGAAGMELLARRLERLVDHEIELAALTDLVPARFELNFGGGELAHLVIEDEELGEILVTGRIDRIDVAHVDGEKVALAIDYKRGSVTGQKPDDMAAARAAQVPVYAMAVEQVLGMKLAGSLLYSTKTLDRRGLAVEGLRVAGIKRKGAMARGEIDRLLSECVDSIRKVARAMRSGDIRISPADEKLCKSCDAADICRFDRWEWRGIEMEGDR